ncbi:hypothetical protein EIB75_10155 [Epilithonimonas vandammei]|uniref:Quinol oxidase subunit 4 n=1 Tax=Epilithonimonas vandammei TaxID=2487072 RepID=A0A3G8Y3C2_9FLAO|nr:hypothetical protein [Epilithonimonas vandammei]AZI39902.1 hypothetical protein EIB74_07965 [Epilithonimonas vandammei]AZI55588.1 hypothetical protein EIB75_10155 [Epilithonimonas vandammei]
MKSFKIYLSLVVFSLSIISCEIRTTTGARTVSGKSVPPGQAKKIYGTKSARPFAPGQNK